ncbi:hypothetical protein BGZ76_003451 [Entomortierella beljakovae]|nr:hypothetical protein BGZ76_003451 [Entomortierella beljakovae]
MVPPPALENDGRPTSARYSHGRISSLGQNYNPPQQPYSPNAATPLPSPHQQYHQYQRMSTASPTPLNGYREDDNRIQHMSTYSQAVNVNDGVNSARQGHVSIQQPNTRYQQQQQQQDFTDPNYLHRPVSHLYNGVPNPSTPATPLPQVRPTQPDTRATRNSNGLSGGISRVAEIFQNAGPLVNLDAPSSSSSNRPLATDQVFARLVRQNPNNPRESDKRERIFKWRDNTVNALTFNPDTNVRGWVIPVVPDELDQPDSIFYMDRITYELDLIAPVGRPFRKAIDINCASGAWAMDLSLKHPRTIVYAIDPSLNVAQLPRQIPENCRFKVRDLKEQEGEFDLVHQRLGAFRIHIQEWTPHFAELSRLTRAGGWIQLAESTGMIVRGGVESLKVNRWVEKAAMSSGLNPIQIVDALIPTILGAGLINVECYEYGIPLGDWAGHRGHIAMRSYLDIVELLREEIIEMNRLEESIFEETIELMKMECSMDKAELIMKVICAQKPPLTDDIWRQA